MSVLTWVKEHPLESGGGAIALFLVIYLLSKSGSTTGSSSDVASVANAQLQQASLANQNAATQAAAQASENQDALAAQVQNNTVAAELAQTVSNNETGVQTATLAAQVQTNQTEAQESVANNTISAELAAQQSQVAAESAGLSTEFDYLTEVNKNQTALSTTELNDVTEGGKNGGIFYGQSATTNEALLSALALSQPGGTATVPYAENALGVTAVSGNQAQASIINSIFSGISGVFSGLFG
jgi:hypothetical protein